MFFVDGYGGVIYSNSKVMVCYLICSDRLYYQFLVDRIGGVISP